MDFKKITPALLISFSAHAVLLGSLWYFSRGNFRAEGQADTAGSAGSPNFIEVSLIPGKVSLSKPLLRQDTSSFQGSAKSENKLGEGGEAGGEGGSSEILRRIRLKIVRSRYYPTMAKRKGMEGRPVVQFKIKNDGTLEYLKLANSSGHPELDQAALRTVELASPLPFFSEPIEVGITYSLTEN